MNGREKDAQLFERARTRHANHPLSLEERGDFFQKVGRGERLNKAEVMEAVKVLPALEKGLSVYTKKLIEPLPDAAHPGPACNPLAAPETMTLTLDAMEYLGLLSIVMICGQLVEGLQARVLNDIVEGMRDE